MDVESIFSAAIGKAPGAERRAFLDGACGGDEAVRRRVEHLLEADDRTAGILERGPDGLADPHEPPGERPGDRVGPYKLLQQIGEGGMGVVYMAEQTEPVRRRVALKIIKPGMDSRQVIARFEAERQALAMMDHQNIARVLDAGTTESGRPYFVMELVQGVPMTQFCDDRHLTPRDRLELFVPVCRAIQHAHQKGVIHRDIKPSNVLVTMYDDKPVPKVIDFGVAKAIEQRLTERTMFTQFGALVGTFEYMSPEQAEMNAFGVDTRSDVYSLGVLLYELLTGSTPLGRERLRTAALHELVRLIKEEEAPRPSARLSSSDVLPKIAAARKTEPGRLPKLVRGELDWIVMKCLEKDRTRRYESAGGLARDVEHYLADEPVEAGPPGAGYRLRKAVRKYRTPLRVAGAFLLLLVVGTVVSIWQAIRATVAEQAAESRKREADDARGQAEKRRDELARLNEDQRRTHYVADMNLARLAWDENNPALTLELLDKYRPRAGEPDLRGFEWYYLDRLAQGGQLRVDAHAGGVTSVAFMPDGKRLISSGITQPLRRFPVSKGTAGAVKLWNAATGRPLPLALDGPSDTVAAVDLSTDGTRLAATHRDRTVLVWDLATGGLVTLEGPADRVAYVVRFSPDGKRLVSLHHPEAGSPWVPGASMIVWDLASRKPVLTVDRVTATRASTPSFGPDGRRIVVESRARGSFTVVYDAETGREDFSLKDPDGFMGSAVFSPDGTRLASHGEKRIRIWDVATHQPVATWPSESWQGTVLAYSPDGTRLAFGGMEGIVEVWDTATGRKVRALKGHAGAIRALAFSPDGARLATGGADGTLRLWEIAEPGDAAPIARPESGSGYADLSPDGRSLLVVGSPGWLKHIELWDTATHRMRGGPIDLPQPLLGHAWSAEGARLYLADEGKTVRVIETASGHVLRNLQIDAEPSMDAIALSPDERWLAYSVPGGTMRVRDARTGAESRTIRGLADEVHVLRFSPDGARLLGVDASGDLKIWDPATGREVAATTLSGMYIEKIRFSRDGTRVVIVGQRLGLATGEVHILDASSAREVWSLRGHMLVVGYADFSPDGRRLVTAGADRTVRIWDLGTGQEILKLSGGPVFRAVRFVADGHRLIGASMDRTIRIWDATPLPE
jgi:eukaryotic-like serine/threonine-protein kinase